MKTENMELFIGIEELRGCTDDQLNSVISEATQKIFELKCQEQHGNKISIRKPHQIKALKRQIAKCKTILNERGRC